jgi:hypothetical protein
VFAVAKAITLKRIIIIRSYFLLSVAIFLVLNLFQDPETSSGLERIFTANEVHRTPMKIDAM